MSGYSTIKLRAQKGTGKPPIGTRKASNLRHGAVAHGPDGIMRKPLKLNKKEKRLGVNTLLYLNFIKNNALYVADSKNLPLEITKTKDFVNYVNSYDDLKGKKILFLSSRINPKSYRNIYEYGVLNPEFLNVRTILKYNQIV
jgi:ribosomal protein L4